MTKLIRTSRSALRWLALISACASTAAFAAPDPAKLAAPGLNGLNLTEQEIQFFSEHFATQFTFEGVKVTTASQIGAVIGLEREKQLLGCQDNSASCITELANALGVDGIITGSIAKIEDVYQLNLKIIAATDASNLSTYSSQVTGQKALLTELNKAAKVMTRLMNEKRAKQRAAAVTAQASGNQATGSTQTGAGQPQNVVAKPQVVQVEDSPAVEPPSAVRKNRITLGPTLLIAGIVPIEYERALNDNFSVAAGVYVSFPAFLLAFGAAALGAGGSLELRFFPLDAPAPEGIWIGPQLTTGFSVFSGELSGQNVSSDLNLVLGYTFISKGGFTASAGLGAGVKYTYVNTGGRTGFGPSLVAHLNLGYAF